MAIPEDRLSSAVQPAGTFIWGRGNPELSAVSDFEYGGIALNDPSQGHEVQEWNTVVSEDGTQIITSAPSVAAAVLYTGAEITEVSCSFDQNMRPAFAFVEAGVAKFEWYDTQVAGRTLTILPAGSITPKVTLDDKRFSQVAASDVLLFYVNNSNLYMQKQRDRYAVEYLMGATLAGHDYLAIAGMSTSLRLVFEFWNFDPANLPPTTVEEILDSAADLATLSGEENPPATAVQFDVGSSTIWKPDNEEI